MATKGFQQEDDIIWSMFQKDEFQKTGGNVGKLSEGCCSSSEGETVKNFANSDRENREVWTEKLVTD